MGKTVLIYLLGTLSVFAVINFNVNNALLNQSTSSYGYYAELRTRDIGNSMVEMLTSQLADSIQFRVTSPTTKNLFGGQAVYTVRDTVVSPDSMVKISVTATYFGQTKKMVSLLMKPGGGGPVPPPAFQYAVFSDGDLQLSGNAEIQSEDEAYNANVHSNGNVQLSGHPEIEGFVTYVNQYSQSGHPEIQPNQNPDNLPVTSQISPVQVPTFNPDDYISIAQQTYSGNFNLSGNNTVALGTAQNPKIIYVGGNLSWSGNVTVTGYGIIVVKGNSQISGNVNFQTHEEDKSTFSLYSVGNIQMSGNSDMYGQYLSLHNIQISGNGEIKGSLAAGGQVQMSGNGEIEYIPANADLTAPIFGNGQQATRPLKASSYYE
ncbi:MAG: hypothetical protein M1391_01065 [Bacteroidetes bacterium]|nr:hypothetical protein [Bacteroidota bacterium]